MSTNAAIQGWQLWDRPWEKTAIYYPPYESATWKDLHNKKSTSFEMLSLFSNSTASRNFNMGILRISCFTVWKHTASRGWILGKLYPPRTSQQVLSAPFGKLRRFCPIYDFSSDNSAVSRSCLQADTGVIRLQPYLRQTSLNFLKWVCLIKLLATIIMGILRISETDDL